MAKSSKTTEKEPEYAIINGHKQQIWRCGVLTYTWGTLGGLISVLFFGDLVITAKGRSIGMVLKLMFKTYGASDTLITIVLSVAGILIGSLLGPIVAVKSDRYRSSWGRRRPFILATVPITAVTIILIALSPHIADYVIAHFGVPANDKNAIVLTSMIVFYILFDIVAVFNGMMFNALVNDVVPHEIMGRIYALFRIASLATGFVYNYFFMGYSKTNPTEMLIGIGLVWGLGYTLMALLVKEGEYPPPPPLAKDNDTWFQKTGKAIATYCKECYSIPFYLLVILFTVLAPYSFSPINFFGVLYADSRGLDLDIYGKCIAISYIVSLVLSYPLGILVDKFHTVRCSVITIVIYTAIMVLSYFAVTWNYTCEIPALVCTNGVHIENITIDTFCMVIIAHIVTSGLYFTVSGIFMIKLFPKDRFAQYVSAQGLPSTIAHAGLTFLMGYALDHWLHNNYRWLFIFSIILGVATSIVGFAIWKMSKRFGGLENYKAP